MPLPLPGILENDKEKANAKVNSILQKVKRHLS